jgi:hypothetical protein
MTEAVIKELATQIYEQEVNNRVSIEKIDILGNHVGIKVSGYIKMTFNIDIALIKKFSDTDNIRFKIEKASSGFYWIREA